MGVINVTPDSFSDGGNFLDPEIATELATEYLNQGADVLDIGAQSTRPGAVEVGMKEELRRLTPALLSIRTEHPKALISVDTFLPKVAEKALEIGADWINDVSGGRRYDQDLIKVVADAGCPYILTHSRGNSHTMDKLTNYENVTFEVLSELQDRTEEIMKIGVQKNKIIWDLGLGFAKTSEQNLQLLRELDTFSDSGFPLLLGPSRKRFIGAVLDEQDPLKRIWGTCAVVSKCVQYNIAMVRVHDIEPVVKTIKMASQII